MPEAMLLTADARAYPVSIEHLSNRSLLTKESPAALANELARHLPEIWTKSSGDILVFLPGKAAIRCAGRLLKESLPEATICPLYSNLDLEGKLNALEPDPSKRRKIIIATSI
ncbi:hypothetical protein RZS08_03615, partial [Arthrospira platensis SPKY1]|nr:hypothetical protein [Arthrospira platensis SPKY1]